MFADDLVSIEYDQLKPLCDANGLPIITGEFGAHKTYQTIEEATMAMHQHVLDFYNQGFVGYMYWTYDTDEQPRIWNAKAGAGRILKALSERHHAEQKKAPDRE